LAWEGCHNFSLAEWAPLVSDGSKFSQSAGQGSTQQTHDSLNTAIDKAGLTESFSLSAEPCDVCGNGVFVFEISFDF
jgi:hypothetical protein